MDSSFRIDAVVFGPQGVFYSYACNCQLFFVFFEFGLFGLGLDDNLDILCGDFL